MVPKFLINDTIINATLFRLDSENLTLLETVATSNCPNFFSQLLLTVVDRTLWHINPIESFSYARSSRVEA